MESIFQKITDLGIVPVVKIMNANDAVDLGKALVKGGLPIAEITFRTDAAEEAMKRLHSELPEILLGAGTVLTVDQVKKAVDAGAEFIVAPGFNPDVVDYCIANNIPVVPGVNSPTQIEMALKRNLRVLKFFPAEASGGLPMLKSMAAPYGDLKFIPTGGVNTANINTYLQSDRVLACGGTWMVKPELISSGKFDEIANITSEAVKNMLGFELMHVGINENNEGSAGDSAKEFASLLSFPVKDGNSSLFVGSEFEIMKSKFLGDHGHLAIGTNNINRAVSYFARNRIATLPETAKEKNGRLIAVYLDKEISGFAVHLLQK
ncbi:MAG: bifunctional 4-hydroxy-2-oxoglutarate aldolase/2-dehydro-3-deoxy-phosphogluconate aldolase [Spirochaetales bacterium]|nr:bifunctional 4-hydroxy-2-oxoglutarate aldolase/2-dehydro-3-deoxy-phosphogluconate aldolase [Spirochaetales bacterium]